MKNSIPKYYVFFDVDGTIVEGKTMLEFLKYYYRERFSPLKIIGNVHYQLFIIKAKIYSLLGKSRYFLNENYYKSYKKMSVSWIEKIGKQWFCQNFSKKNNTYITTIINELAMHKNNGAEVVFVSGSFSPCLDPIANVLGVKHILATTLEIKNGCYTGEILQPQTIGIGKVKIIRDFLRKQGYSDYQNCYAYGDHHSDIPMLSLVGNPVVVSGDKQMECFANEKGWRVVNAN